MSDRSEEQVFSDRELCALLTGLRLLEKVTDRNGDPAIEKCQTSFDHSATVSSPLSLQEVEDLGFRILTSICNHFNRRNETVVGQ